MLDHILQSLQSILENGGQKVLEIQQALCSFPALSPENGGEGEWAKMAWIETYLRQNNVRQIERLDSPDPRVPSGLRPNLIARLPGSAPEYLWLIAHADVVPAGEESLWNSNPWEAVRDAKDPDIIRGRGVEDNQQAIVSALLLAEIVATLPQEALPCGLAILIVADEETGNAHGIDFVTSHKPHIFSKHDKILVPDYGSATGDTIEVAEKGVLWLKVTVTGKQCHASSPDSGKNALLAAAHFITRVPLLEERYNALNPLFSPSRTTFVPTRHDANVPNINTMPGKDVFFVDCRILPCYSIDGIFHAFQVLAEKVGEEFGVAIEVEEVNREPLFPPTPDDAAIVQSLKAGIARVYGLEAKTCGAGGSTVAGHIRGCGYYAAAWQKAIPNYHAPNEGSRISSAVRDAMVYACMLFS